MAALSILLRQHETLIDFVNRTAKDHEAGLVPYSAVEKRQQRVDKFVSSHPALRRHLYIKSKHD